MEENRMLRADRTAESLDTHLSRERRNSLRHQAANRQRRQTTRLEWGPVPERHLYRIPEAMQLLSMSRSVIYEQIRSGRLRTVNQGRSRLVPKAAIVEYINLLIRESEGASYDKAS
jgi:excisionase family DNA binding protein